MSPSIGFHTSSAQMNPIFQYTTPFPPQTFPSSNFSDLFHFTTPMSVHDHPLRLFETFNNLEWNKTQDNLYNFMHHCNILLQYITSSMERYFNFDIPRALRNFLLFQKLYTVSDDTIRSYLIQHFDPTCPFDNFTHNIFPNQSQTPLPDFRFPPPTTPARAGTPLLPNPPPLGNTTFISSNSNPHQSPQPPYKAPMLSPSVALPLPAKAKKRFQPSNTTPSLSICHKCENLGHTTYECIFRPFCSTCRRNHRRGSAARCRGTKFLPHLNFHRVRYIHSRTKRAKQTPKHTSSSQFSKAHSPSTSPATTSSSPSNSVAPSPLPHTSSSSSSQTSSRASSPAPTPPSDTISTASPVSLPPLPAPSPTLSEPTSVATTISNVSSLTSSHNSPTPREPPSTPSKLVVKTKQLNTPSEHSTSDSPYTNLITSNQFDILSSFSDMNEPLLLSSSERSTTEYTGRIKTFKNRQQVCQQNLVTHTHNKAAKSAQHKELLELPKETMASTATTRPSSPPPPPTSISKDNTEIITPTTTVSSLNSTNNTTSHSPTIATTLLHGSSPPLLEPVALTPSRTSQPSKITKDTKASTSTMNMLTHQTASFSATTTHVTYTSKSDCPPPQTYVTQPETTPSNNAPLPGCFTPFSLNTSNQVSISTISSHTKSIENISKPTSKTNGIPVPNQSNAPSTLPTSSQATTSEYDALPDFGTNCLSVNDQYDFDDQSDTSSTASDPLQGFVPDFSVQHTFVLPSSTTHVDAPFKNSYDYHPASVVDGVFPSNHTLTTWSTATPPPIPYVKGDPERSLHSYPSPPPVPQHTFHNRYRYHPPQSTLKNTRHRYKL